MDWENEDLNQEAEAGYSEDDGLFKGNDAGDKHYHATFDRNSLANRKAGNASSLLSSAEKGAASGVGGDKGKKAMGGSMAGQLNAEKGGVAGAAYKNNVAGKMADTAVKLSGNNPIVKKIAPVIAIVATICGFGGFSIMGQSSMPFSLISQFQENFDSIGTSNGIRSKHLLKMQIDEGKVKDCKKATIFGKEKFKVTAKQKKKLAAAGITMEKQGRTTVMKFTDVDGVEKTVTPAEFDTYYDSNSKFHDAYYEGSRTWRGAVSDWFDSLSIKFFDWLGIGRNTFAQFKKSNDSEADEAEFKQTITETADADGVKGTANTSDATGGEDTDGDGEIDTYDSTHGSEDFEMSRADVEVDANGKITDTSKLAKKVNDFTNSFGAKTTGIATAVANGACGILNVAGALGLIAAAYQTAMVVKTAAAIFEGIQKGQVEPSEISPINEIANALTTKAPNSYYLDKDTQSETTRKSAMEANGIAAIFGNMKTNPNDPSVKSFNILASIGAFLGFGIGSFKACTYTQLAAATVDAVMGVVEVVACVFSFGIGCVLSIAKDAALSAGISATLAIAAEAIIPVLAQVVTRNIATEVMGEDLGNALVSGANIYMGSNHQFGGGSLATKDSLSTFLSQRDAIIADQARYERSVLSPFDTSSKYTFMGTLLTNLYPISTQVSSVSTSITSIGNVLTKSISSIMPGASAVSAAITAQEAAEGTSKNCIYLDSIGAVGDVFCNPYFITDLTTVERNPADIVNVVHEKYGGFENDEEEEVPTIKENSKLAKHIIYCGQRQSPFGMADQNIAGAITSGTSTGSGVGDALVGSVPIVGDVIGIIEQDETLKYYGYISGEACVTGNTGDGRSVPDWSETKYYQRFIEDQRLAESMGLVEKSSVTAFLEKHYEKNPLDNSFEGILARRSGLTKENVIAILDIAEQQQFLATYDPTNLYPLPASEFFEEVTNKLVVENEENPVEEMAIMPRIYSEERYQRNYAI